LAYHILVPASFERQTFSYHIQIVVDLTFSLHCLLPLANRMSLHHTPS
jgi:hypothetical protein